MRFLARHTSFDRAMGVAFDGIRHFGASNPGVMLKLLENLAVLGGLVDGSRRATVVSYAGSVRRAARRHIEVAEDLASVEAAVSRFPELTGSLEARHGDAWWGFASFVWALSLVASGRSSAPHLTGRPEYE